MIISFSGLDGAGKTTQINKLLNFYQKQGMKTASIYTLFPDLRYHTTDQLQSAYNYLKNFDVIHIRFRLNSDSNSIIMRKLESAPYMQPEIAYKAAIQGYNDHMELSHYILYDLIDANKTLLFDRYYYDELAFKQVYGCSSTALDQLYSNIISPDYAFYIYISPETCYMRNINRPDGEIPLYSNIQSIQMLQQIFNTIALKKNLITLDGSFTEEKVFKHIQAHLFGKKTIDNLELSCIIISDFVELIKIFFHIYVISTYFDHYIS